MWYVRVWIGPQSLPPGALVGRLGVTGFVAGGGLRTAKVSTLGWAILLPGFAESPFATDWQGKQYTRYDAEIRLAQIAQMGRYYSATWVYARQIGDVR
jgi:hypothetical protein